MATIQERHRYHAKVVVNGEPVQTRSFSLRSEAETWTEGRLEAAVAAGRSKDELRAQVRKRTAYKVMVRLRGHPPAYATFPRKSDAKQWAQTTEAAVRDGRYFKTSEAKRHTLAELIDRYKREVLALKPVEKRRDQERHLDWWRDQIGDVLAEVTPALIVEHRSILAGETTIRKSQRSPSTVNRYLASLGHAFAVASREWEWTSENPVRKVKKLPEPRGRVRYLDDSELQGLLAACGDSAERRLYPLVQLAIATGARRGELLALRWPDVDFKRGVAVLHDTKNKERRAIPLSEHVLPVLRDFRKVRQLGTDLVFADSRGKATFPRKAWEQALVAAKIEDFRFHDLRHSAASYLAMSGATLAEIAEVLGHKTLAMVKRYSHLTEQHTSKVVARMNEQIFGEGQ